MSHLLFRYYAYICIYTYCFDYIPISVHMRLTQRFIALLHRVASSFFFSTGEINVQLKLTTEKDFGAVILT